MLDLLAGGHSSPAACLRKCIKEIIQNLIWQTILSKGTNSAFKISHFWIFWAMNTKRRFIYIYIYIYLYGDRFVRFGLFAWRFPHWAKLHWTTTPMNPGIPRLPATEYSVSMETSTPVQSWQSVLKHPIKNVIVGFSVTMAAIRDNPKLRDYGWTC